MTGRREDGAQGEGWPLHGPFEETELLRVFSAGCGRSSWSTDLTANSPSVESSVVEARFGPSGIFEWTYHFSKRSKGLADVLWICIATSVREVRERRFSQ